MKRVREQNSRQDTTSNEEDTVNTSPLFQINDHRRSTELLPNLIDLALSSSFGILNSGMLSRTTDLLTEIVYPTVELLTETVNPLTETGCSWHRVGDGRGDWFRVGAGRGSVGRSSFGGVRGVGGVVGERRRVGRVVGERRVGGGVVRER